MLLEFATGSFNDDFLGAELVDKLLNHSINDSYTSRLCSDCVSIRNCIVASKMRPNVMASMLESSLISLLDLKERLCPTLANSISLVSLFGHSVDSANRLADGIE